VNNARKKSLSVKQFLAETREMFSLELVNGVEEGPVPITLPDIHRPGLALAGFMQNYLNERIQILGETEILYLNTRSEDVRHEAVERLFSVPLVSIIVTRGLDIPVELLRSATSHQVPLLRTSMITTPFIHELTRYLDDSFADTCEIHGTLVDVYGVGLLFTGHSGIGKSEIALDLLERGHRLVADDTVHVTRIAEDVLIGRGNQHLRHFMEIRGIGIINVQDLFGIRAVRVQKRIEVEVLLDEWDPKKDWNRAGLDDRLTRILDVQLPQVVIPLFPGKNITVISEVIAMNHMLKVYGVNAAEKFNTLLIDIMKSDRQTRHYLRYDQE
jgi:HPr kinase/phosphorylase